MISAEFIVNVGQYQHVKVTISEENIIDFGHSLIEFTDLDKNQLGVFQAELESWVKGAHQKAFEDAQNQAVETVMQQLGATVQGEEESAPNSVLADAAPVASDQPAWARPIESKPKAWEKPKGMDDF